MSITQQVSKIFKKKPSDGCQGNKCHGLALLTQSEFLKYLTYFPIYTYFIVFQVIKVWHTTVNFEHFSWCDMAYFGPRCSIFWYYESLSMKIKGTPNIFLKIVNHSWSSACCWKCLFRRITSPKRLAIFYHLKVTRHRQKQNPLHVSLTGM